MKGNCLPTRLNNLSDLQLNPPFENKLRKIIHDNRMQYELWMESAPTFNDFISRLKKRHYKVTPNTSKPMFPFYLHNVNTPKDVNKQVLSKISNKKMMSRQSRKKIN